MTYVASIHHDCNTLFKQLPHILDGTVFPPIIASCVEGIAYLSRKFGVVYICTNSTLYSPRI